jgi:hypothetical protein
VEDEETPSNFSRKLLKEVVDGSGVLLTATEDTVVVGVCMTTGSIAAGT